MGNKCTEVGGKSNCCFLPRQYLMYEPHSLNTSPAFSAPVPTQKCAEPFSVPVFIRSLAKLNWLVFLGFNKPYPKSTIYLVYPVLRS